MKYVLSVLLLIIALGVFKLILIPDVRFRWDANIIDIELYNAYVESSYNVSIRKGDTPINLFECAGVLETQKPRESWSVLERATVDGCRAAIFGHGIPYEVSLNPVVYF